MRYPSQALGHKTSTRHLSRMGIKYNCYVPLIEIN
jgi:hypothetical protein